MLGQLRDWLSELYYKLAEYYHHLGNSKKEKFHAKAVAILGCEVARYKSLGAWRVLLEIWNKL